MNGWLDEWMNEYLLNEWMNEWMNEWVPVERIDGKDSVSGAADDELGDG